MIFTSSIVIAGGPFSPALFDERALEESLGKIDSENSVRLGDQLARYTYGNAQFELVIQQERIDLKSTSDDFLTEALEKAFRIWSESFTSFPKTTKFKGLGLNCDGVIESELLQTTGDEFCKRYVMSPDAASVLGVEAFYAVTGRYIFDLNGARYYVRIEPHFSSELENLYTAVNAHQDTEGLQDLLEKLGHTTTFRTYTKELHDRLIKAGGKL